MLWRLRSTYLLIDKYGKEHTIFSPYTLFTGNIHCLELAQKVGH